MSYLISLSLYNAKLLFTTKCKQIMKEDIPSYGVNRDTGVNRDKNPESFCNAIIYIFLQFISLVLITLSSIDIEVPSHCREDQIWRHIEELQVIIWYVKKNQFLGSGQNFTHISGTNYPETLFSASRPRLSISTSYQKRNKTI